MSEDGMFVTARAAFDPVLDAAPEMPAFDDIVEELGRVSARPRRSPSLGAVVIGVSVLVVAATGAVIALGRAGGDVTTGGPTSTEISVTTTTATPSTTVTTITTPTPAFAESQHTYTLADGMTVYSVTDCPSAPNLLIGGYDAADALPVKGQTDRARVEEMLDSVRQYHVGRDDVIDVRVVPRNGEVWYRLNTGGYAVERLGDYQYEFILSPDGACPTEPLSVNGVPVLYNRAADDQALIDSTSTDNLQLDIIDIYPAVAGIDSLFLRNISTEPIDVSAWTISSRGFNKGFTVPDNTAIQPGESIAIYQGTETRGAQCREDTARVFFHCNALGQDTVTGDMLFPIPIITVLDSSGTLVLESNS